MVHHGLCRYGRPPQFPAASDLIIIHQQIEHEKTATLPVMRKIHDLP
jgi:hypothetical protein